MVNKRQERVSVCIPVYNGSPYIAESIESVLTQTYGDFHLYVCDNCSTDNTADIVASYKDSRLTYLRNETNIGMVGNANRCLDLARGEYICVWHHDDVMMPDNLEKKVRLLDEHPEVGFVHSNLIIIDPQGKVIDSNIWCKDSRRDYVEHGDKVLKRFLLSLPFGSSIFIGAVLARRAGYDRVGRFRHELPHCNDSEMWMRMMLFADVACIGTPLVKYRVHPVSATSAWGNYMSIACIKEHYLAAQLVFDHNGQYIQDLPDLRRQVASKFAEHAVRSANASLNNGMKRSGKELLREAVMMAPRVVGDTLFWKTAARLTIGARGMNLLRAIRDNAMKVICL